MKAKTETWGVLFVCVSFIQGSLSRDNYPYGGIKPCSKRKCVHDFIGPLCVPTEKGFVPESVENCKKLKERCPEFNQASCVWQPWSWDEQRLNQSCPLQRDILFPACKLRYYATPKFYVTKRTWIEIMYVNQYGTANYSYTMFTTVELHRYIWYLRTFKDSEQPDFPLSVPGNGPQGRSIKLVSNATVNFANSNFCKDGIDTSNTCHEEGMEYIVKHYGTGFGDPRDGGARISNTTNRTIDRITMKYATKCIKDLVNTENVDALTWRVVDVCQVRLTKVIEKDFELYERRNETEELCDAQFYSVGNQIKLRYTYDLPVVPPNTA